MDHKKLFDVLKNIFGRAAFVYVVFILILMPLINYPAAMSNAKGAVLSRLMPESFDYLRELEQGKSKPEKKRLLDYTDYFQRITEYLPERADAYGMLGFCYYHEGLFDKAVNAYKKAVARNSHFFSFHYNLGLIYYKTGRYEEAVASLTSALATKLQENLLFISQSRIYYPFFPATENLGQTMQLRFRENYRNCYTLLILSSYKLKKYAEMRRLADEAIGSALDNEGYFYYYAGLAEFHRQQYMTALPFFKETIAKNPGYSESYYYLGLSVKAMGQETIAQQVLQKAMGLNKTNGASRAPEDQMDIKIF